MLNSVIFFGASTPSSGIGALGINGTDFLIQLITFVIVILVLKRFALKPILHLLKERRQTIDSGVKLGEEMKKKSRELEDQINKQLQLARSQADEIVQAAQQNSRQIIKDAEQDARAKVDNILAEADVRIKQETVRARKRLERDLVDLIAETTEVIIEEKVDAKKDSQLIEKALSRRTA